MKCENCVRPDPCGGKVNEDGECGLQRTAEEWKREHADTPETLAAIIAEMRHRADNHRQDGWESVGEELDDLADRIESANVRALALLAEERAQLETKAESEKRWANEYFDLARRREDALVHCRQYAQKIERENDEGETRLDAEEIIATVDNEFAGIRPKSAPGNAAAMRDTHGVTGDGWYGFDLDGTLARYDGWKGIDHIGEPIPAMVALVKRLHAEGKIVKIMTARVAPRNDTVDGHDARYYVCKWCAEHLGFTPDVVFQKDARMIQLYDDRVKQVVPNTGILVENLAGRGNAAAMREALVEVEGAIFEDEPGRFWLQDPEAILHEVQAALAEPARNCDVGTAREQIDRFNDFCLNNAPACPDCPLYRNLNTYEIHGFGRNECMAFWGQLPFVPAEGGAE